MLITEQEVEARLNSNKNLLNKLASRSSQFTPIPRGDGSKGSIPVKLKSTAALLTRLGESVSKTGHNLGISTGYTQNLKLGQRNLPEEEIDERIKHITNLATNKLLATIEKLSDEKLEKSTAKDLSTITKNLFGIAFFDKVNGHENSGNAPTVVVYAPQIKQENHYNEVEG